MNREKAVQVAGYVVSRLSEVNAQHNLDGLNVSCIQRIGLWMYDDEANPQRQCLYSVIFNCDPIFGSGQNVCIAEPVEGGPMSILGIVEMQSRW